MTWNGTGENVEDKPLVHLNNDELTSIANESYLAPGNAERTFFSVCGNNSTTHGYGDDEGEEEESDEEGEQRKHLINDQTSPTCVRASIKVKRLDSSGVRGQRHLIEVLDLRLRIQSNHFLNQDCRKINMVLYVSVIVVCSDRIDIIIPFGETLV